MRVAYLTSQYPAVSHTFILREVEALRAHGVDVTTCSIREVGREHKRGSAEAAAAASTYYVVAAAKRPGTLLAALGTALARPGRLGEALRVAWSTRRPGIRGTLYQLFYLIESMVLSRHLKTQGATHIHNHFAMSSCSVAMLTSVLSGIPYSFTMHGPSIFFEPRVWRLDEKIRRASFVACISHFCRSQGMIFADRADWQKLRIVHCGIEPERYDRHRADTPGKRLLFVGRLASVKGVAVLLRALATVRRAHPDATLTLIGDGDERAGLEAEAESLGLTGAVRFAGYRTQDEVIEELARSDLFVLPSFAEGVPVVLMEAMAARLPVLATRIAGIGELVEPGVSGALVAPGDQLALEEALGTLLSRDTRELGEAGRVRVVADYDVRAEAAWLAELLAGRAPQDQIRPLPPQTEQRIAV